MVANSIVCLSSNLLLYSKNTTQSDNVCFLVYSVSKKVLHGSLQLYLFSRKVYSANSLDDIAFGLILKKHGQ